MENTFALKLKELRERHHLSLQDLADQVGVAKQSIHKFENDLLKPSSETVAKLAKVFNKDYSYFSNRRKTSNYSLENIKFRDSHQLEDRNNLLLGIKQEVLDYVSHFLELESLMDIKRTFENPLMEISIVNERDIERAAKQLRKRWKLGFGPIAEVVETLESKGVFVVEIDREENFSGLSALISDEVPIVVLNQNCRTIERKRFTAFHELGHIILQFAQNFSDQKIEFFCDHFAGAVLIVDEAVYDELGKKRTIISIGELRRIKEVYGISVQALIVRAKYMGFIDMNTYTSWMSSYDEWKASKTQATKFSPFRGREKPSRFNNILVRGIAEQRISLSKAAEIAGMKIDILRQQMDELKFPIPH